MRQLPQGRSGHIPAAHCDGAFQSSASAMLEQPVDELDDRGFAAPALAGEKDQFSRFYRKRTVPKTGFRPPFIGVRHMVEGDHGSTPLQQIPPTHRARNSRGNGHVLNVNTRSSVEDIFPGCSMPRAVADSLSSSDVWAAPMSTGT